MDAEVFGRFLGRIEAFGRGGLHALFAGEPHDVLGRDAEFAEDASRGAFAPAHESHQVHELIDAALAAAGGLLRQQFREADEVVAQHGWFTLAAAGQAAIDQLERYADLLDSAADGSGTWITGHGQQIRIEPRPFLHDPLDHTHDPEPPPEPPEPPKSPKPPLPDTPPF